MFDELFSPVKIGRTVIKNRLALAPMFVAGLVEIDGSYSQRAIDYYEEIAKGGTGLIISSVTRVENEIEKMAFVCPRPTPSNMPNYRELTEAIHYHDARFFAQLTAGFGRNAPVIPGARPVSASSIPHFFNPHLTCRELTIEEIEAIVKAFGDVAEILAFVGVDGIEIHGHEGYLLDQFATALWNRRRDKYGGGLEDRLRFAIEILHEIKSRVGKDFPVQYRYGMKHYLKAFDKGAAPGEQFTELGRDLDESVEMARILEQGGYDALHIDRGGCYDSYYWAHPPTYTRHGAGLDALIHQIKDAVTIPVLVCSRFDLPELAERVVREGRADVIVLGRGLLADPHWPRKVWEGRIEDIRPCIGCQTGCLGRNEEGGTIACAVNPITGKERIWELRPATVRRDILVVGGGIGGMEAARVLAERGHGVSLYEKTEELGGHLKEASIPDFKRDLRSLLLWYKRQLEKLNVPVYRNTPVTPEMGDQLKPDAIILATGSEHRIPEVPGIDRTKVHTAMDVLLSRKSVKDPTVVVGGSLTGCEVALWLARKGKDVTLIERLPELMADVIGRPNKEMLLDMLDRQGVDTRTNTSLAGVTDTGVQVVQKGCVVSIDCESVVLAAGLKPENHLGNALRARGHRVYEIGDCKHPGIILNAVWDAYKIANAI